MTEKVLLAFSGGLDTSVCVKLLEEKYDVEVITACVDVGQGEEEMEKAKNSAPNIGGLKHYNIDAKEEFANEYIARGIKANAEYEGYPLSTAFARPLIAQKLIDRNLGIPKLLYTMTTNTINKVKKVSHNFFPPNS